VGWSEQGFACFVGAGTLLFGTNTLLIRAGRGETGLYFKIVRTILSQTLCGIKTLRGRIFEDFWRFLQGRVGSPLGNNVLVLYNLYVVLTLNTFQGEIS